MAKLKVLVLTGGSQAHDHAQLGPLLVNYLENMGDIEPTLIHDDKSVLESSDLKSYDLCVFYVTIRSLTKKQEANLVDFVSKGKGFVGIHPSTVIAEENKKYINMIGSRFITHSHYHEFPVIIKDKHHPISQGIGNFRISDELYVVDYDIEKVHILATTDWEGKELPMAYTKNYGDGKVFYLALGHDITAWKHEAFQKFLWQGVAWAIRR